MSLMPVAVEITGRHPPARHHVGRQRGEERERTASASARRPRSCRGCPNRHRTRRADRLRPSPSTSAIATDARRRAEVDVERRREPRRRRRSTARRPSTTPCSRSGCAPARSSRPVTVIWNARSPPDELLRRRERAVGVVQLDERVHLVIERGRAARDVHRVPTGRSEVHVGTSLRRSRARSARCRSTPTASAVASVGVSFGSSAPDRVAGRGAAGGPPTAASGSTMPCPNAGSTPGSPTSRAVSRIWSATCACVQLGCWDRINAATPATIGDENDVPDSVG